MSVMNIVRRYLMRVCGVLRRNPTVQPEEGVWGPQEEPHYAACSWDWHHYLYLMCIHPMDDLDWCCSSFNQHHQTETHPYTCTYCTSIHTRVSHVLCDAIRSDWLHSDFIRLLFIVAVTAKRQIFRFLKHISLIYCMLFWQLFLN